MNELQLFDFHGQQIRTLLIDDEPWFVGKDVAEVLGYKNGSRDVNRHVDDEDKLKYQIGTSGQNRNLIIINESGLYSLILSSKLPQAKEFKRWVTSEVLPAIRQTGRYDQRLNDFAKLPFNEQLLMVMTNQQKEMQETKERLNALENTIETKLYLTPGESRELTAEIARRVHQLMKLDRTECYYKELSAYYFRSISKQLKDYFNVSNRNMILSKDFDEAMRLVNEIDLDHQSFIKVGQEFSRLKQTDYLYAQIGKVRR